MHLAFPSTNPAYRDEMYNERSRLRTNEHEVGGGPEFDSDLSALQRANDRLLPKGEHREIPDFPIIRDTTPYPSRERLQDDRK